MKLLGCFALIGLLCLVESHDNKTARFEGKVFVKKTPRYSVYPEGKYIIFDFLNNLNYYHLF